MGLDNPLHIAFLLVIMLLVFGAKRLPEMGRSLGDGLRGFKTSLEGTAAPQGLAAPQDLASPQGLAAPTAAAPVQAPAESYRGSPAGQQPEAVAAQTPVAMPAPVVATRP
jgi:sec-independent protein translocase protein TatA